VLAGVLAAGILALWGFTLWTAIVTALLLVCPAILVWAMIYFGRDDAAVKRSEEDRTEAKP
jgi:hypothetical protein